MRHEATPLVVPASQGGVGDRVLRWCLSVALRASLLVSPAGRAARAKGLRGRRCEDSRALERHAPADVVATLDERYGEDADMLLDVFARPMWTGRFRSSCGSTAAGSSAARRRSWRLLQARRELRLRGRRPRYSLAPEHRYPTPTRQMMRALGYVKANAERWGSTRERIALAGDSAGAQIAAQIGALVTTPGYADAVGVSPTITVAELRGGRPRLRPLRPRRWRSRRWPGTASCTTMLWAYSGKRRFSTIRRSQRGLGHRPPHVCFPAALVTRRQRGIRSGRTPSCLPRGSRAPESRPETLFFADDDAPQLGHEYQFDLDTEAGRLFLDRLHTFPGQRLGALAPP